MSATELYFRKQFFSYNSQGQEKKKKRQRREKGRKKKCQPIKGIQNWALYNDGKAKTVQSRTTAQRASSEGVLGLSPTSWSQLLVLPWGPAASSSLPFSSPPGHLRRWSVLWPKSRACERIHRTKPIRPGPKPSAS